MSTEPTTDNYCQHRECHNSHVAWYWDSWSTGTASHPPRINGHWMSWRDPTSDYPMLRREFASAARRWCKSHALIFEGVAFG